MERHPGILALNEERDSFRSPFLPNFVMITLLGGVLGYAVIWLDSGPDLDPIGLLVAGAAALIASAYGSYQLVSKFLVYSHSRRDLDLQRLGPLSLCRVVCHIIRVALGLGCEQLLHST